MLVVAMVATAMGKVIMATTSRTTGASAPAVIMMSFVVVSPVSTTRGYFHNPVVAMVLTASRMPLGRWYRRQSMVSSMVSMMVSMMASSMASSMAPSMTLHRHSLHVLPSLDFLHLLPIVRWNLLASQDDVVQLLSFECQSSVPLIIVLQLKCIQVLLAPEFLLVKTQLSISFPPVPFLDLVLSPSTAIVWNHGPIISSATSVHVVCDVPAILGKGKTFDARFVGRAGAPFLYFQTAETKEEGQVHCNRCAIQLKKIDQAMYNENSRLWVEIIT